MKKSWAIQVTVPDEYGIATAGTAGCEACENSDSALEGRLVLRMHVAPFAYVRVSERPVYVTRA